MATLSVDMTGSPLSRARTPAHEGVRPCPIRIGILTTSGGMAKPIVRSAMRLGLVLALFVFALAIAAGVWAQPIFGPAQDPLAGSRIFGSKGCVKCHSVNGVGGKVGPDLGRIARPHSFYDLATAMWNHLPRMVDRMKQLGIARPQLDARETADLVAFLYSLGYFDVPGDAKVGRRLFTQKRCVVCHQVGGVGGIVGPNLDHLRQFRSPIFVAAAMWNHGPAMAEAMRARGIERPVFTAAELRDLIAFLASATGATEGPVYVVPGRAADGRRLFSEKRCIECHAVGGEGGRVGPDLVERAARRSLLELAAAMWNKAPAMMAAMKPRGIAVPQLRADEMADLVAYLYSVGYFAPPGGVQRGWKVALDKGCLVCHGVAGERGKPASDLSRVRNLDSPAAVLAALWNHALVTAPTPGGDRAPWPEFRAEEMVDLVTMLQSVRHPR
jgi:mono/diheme cytochrome c family protein